MYICHFCKKILHFFCIRTNKPNRFVKRQISRIVFCRDLVQISAGKPTIFIKVSRASPQLLQIYSEILSGLGKGCFLSYYHVLEWLLTKFWVGDWINWTFEQVVTANDYSTITISTLHKSLYHMLSPSSLLQSPLAVPWCSGNSSIVPTKPSLHRFPYNLLLTKVKSKSMFCYNCRSIGILVSSTHLGLKTRFVFLSDIWEFVDVGRYFWREDESVVYSVQYIYILHGFT
jgi:hypothetical protein